MGIDKIVQIRNVGKFGSVSLDNQPPLGRFAVVFAENGKGKTTISEIFRSLSTGNPDHVTNRKRLQSSDADVPHVALEVSGEPVVFDGDRWSKTISGIHIFDDIFVAENVCSGIEVDPTHRKNMHEIIIGKKGKDLFDESEVQKDNLEKQNEIVKRKMSDIPQHIRGPYPINDYCDLPEDENIDKRIELAERKLAAAKSSDKIKKQNKFKPIYIPKFDLDKIHEILKMGIESIENAAMQNVRMHMKDLEPNGESWVSDGMLLIDKASKGTDSKICPFCKQKIDGLEIIHHYQEYFGDAYKNLKDSIIAIGKKTKSDHSAAIIGQFDNSIREIVDTYAFWKDYTDLEQVEIDADGVKSKWTKARDSVLIELRAKLASPLDPRELSDEAKSHVKDFMNCVSKISAASQTLQSNNQRINDVKKTSLPTEVGNLEKDVTRLKAHKARYSTEIVERCEAYKESLAQKKILERSRRLALKSLNEYREQIFPRYKDAINTYLSKFSTGFRIESITPVNIKSGSTVKYAAVIDEKSVSLIEKEGPSFRTLLSAGDRSALAFAFFLASLDVVGDEDDQIVILDDPITSLDEHRLHRTQQMITSLVSKVDQVIVLSHSRSFLHSLWDDVRKGDEVQVNEENSSSVKIVRKDLGSDIEGWDIRYDMKSNYSKSHKLVRDFIDGHSYAKERVKEVNSALRIIIEGYLSIVFVEYFRPNRPLGNFIEICVKQEEEGCAILSKSDLKELRILKNYANDFHHDTDPLEIETFNETEFLDFAKCTINFCTREGAPFESKDNESE